MKIESQDRTIQQIFQSNFFQIPRFQRPYSWDTDNIADFLQDAIQDSDSDYFIGSMVVYRIKDSTIGIVDGQQRLTTITMMLCALRNAFATQGFPDLALGLHSLIERKDINNKPTFVLHTETSYPYLQEYIQKDGVPEIEPKIRAEEENLKLAFENITSFLEQKIDTEKKSLSTDDHKAKDAVKNALIAIRDKVLGLKVIFVTLDNEDEAYIIFETLNTRGKDLSLSDLVKGHITRLAKPKNVNVDTTKDKWAQIVRVIEDSSADITTNTLIHHYWLSTYEYLPVKKIYKDIKKHVKSPSDAIKFLDSLVQDSITYREINEVSFRKWKAHEFSIRTSLDALTLFKVKQPLPMLLAAMREYRKGFLKKKHVEDILGAIEHFHFIFTAVTSQRSSGGIATMYASHARQLHAADTLEGKIKVLSSLKKKLKDRKPDEAEFSAAFANIRYSDKYPKSKKLVQYVLAKIGRLHENGIPIDYEQMTIEHIAAQNSPDAYAVSDEKCAEIGNLIFIDSQLNIKLANKKFHEKVNLLQQSKVTVDEVLEKASVWNENTITERTTELAHLAYRKVWWL